MLVLLMFLISRLINRSGLRISHSKVFSSEIGVLRLQPKVLKLKVINYANIEKLTSRGINSSMKDPIKVVQKILDKVFSHLLFYVEEKFHSIFGIVSPSVTGVTEAINCRFKKTKTGDWGNSLEMEGDFSDLFSNCNADLLIECAKESCKYAHFHDSNFFIYQASYNMYHVTLLF